MIPVPEALNQFHSMEIISNIDELRSYLPALASLNIDSVKPFFADAENTYLDNYLDSTTKQALLTWYKNGQNPNEAKYQNLLPYVQRIIARFSVLLGADPLNVKLTDSGFAVVSNQNLTPASPERVQKFKESIENSAYSAVELMLKFLETNKGTYTAWASSDKYTLAVRNLINSAQEFNKYFNINESRVEFYKIRLMLDDVERLKIIPAISQAYFDVILTAIKANNLTAHINAVLPYLRRSAANFLYSDKDPRAENNAKHYLTMALKIMDATPANYPEYAASDSYSSTRTTYGTQENTAASKTFTFGL